eukprot:SAG11_NODE_302_length_11005_cov_12.491748_7_plen_44_part_00
MSGEIPGAQNDAETLLGLLKLAGGADLKKVRFRKHPKHSCVVG